ncbi:TOBE domain-containing protein [Leptolyngbya sp. 7M]|uniref:TOBE domain-containing protein n=1 Tax=Leptolyngbya sp. 7M TaxID=2812896 RepID=UPI001B8B9472|nr:TOBE domain-containing protein [Leptolyngbya sp. 7M]QYO66541.1 TOBE domain-containing protein [Leptolyngbya sp. 7M]
MSLRVNSISKRLGNDWILRNVSFSAVSGEIIAVYSDDARSSDSLLRIIAGSERANGGNADPETSPPVLISKQSDAGFDFFGLTIRRSSKRSGSFSPLEAIKNAKDAGILLIDSPFAARFKTERSRIGDQITSVAESGSIVIFSTEDFKDALEYADRVLVILHGELEQDALPQTVYDEPSTVAVAKAVGRHNLIEARRLTSSKNDVPEFVTIEGEHRLFARPTEKAKLGAINKNVTLAIRPEQISISFGASFPEDNLLKASVTAIHPMGPTTRVLLDCSGLVLEALVLRVVGLEIGDECMVGLPPDRIAVLAN